jgi:hypothetical protein
MLPTTIIGFDIHSFRKEFCFTTVENMRRSLPAMIDPPLTGPVLLICPQVGQARQLLTRPRTDETREGSGARACRRLGKLTPDENFPHGGNHCRALADGVRDRGRTICACDATKLRLFPCIRSLRRAHLRNEGALHGETIVPCDPGSLGQRTANEQMVHRKRRIVVQCLPIELKGPAATNRWMFVRFGKTGRAFASEPCPSTAQTWPSAQPYIYIYT